MERTLCEFTPYEIGRITAQYNSSERFKKCDAIMKRITAHRSYVDNFLMGLSNQDESRTYLEVTKRVIFACYLISRSMHNDLVQIGDEKVANAVDSLFQTKGAS